MMTYHVQFLLLVLAGWVNRLHYVLHPWILPEIELLPAP